MQDRKKKNKNTRNLLRVTPRHPPQFNTTLTVNHKFRFTALIANVSVPISRQNLLNLIFMATSATAGDRIYSAIRLRRVTVWSPILATFAPQTVSIEWMGQYAPSNIRSDTSEGTQPAVISSKPPKFSSTGMWGLSGSDEADIAFNLTCPVGAVIDVDVTFKLVDHEPQQTTGEAYIGETIGVVYYNYLDGYATKMLLAAGGVRPPL
jgi:hypothetical protein